MLETENGTCGKITSYSSACPVLDSRWRSCMDNNRDALRKDASSLGDVSSSGGGEYFLGKCLIRRYATESNDSGGKLEGAMCSVQRTTYNVQRTSVICFPRRISLRDFPRGEKETGNCHESLAAPPDFICETCIKYL